MLNNIEIKKFPSKERMAQISEKWKILPQEQKDWLVFKLNYSKYFKLLNDNTHPKISQNPKKQRIS
jgi:hypothetical protein